MDTVVVAYDDNGAIIDVFEDASAAIYVLKIGYQMKMDDFGDLLDGKVLNLVAIDGPYEDEMVHLKRCSVKKGLGR